MSSKNTIQTENDNEWVISSSGFSKEDILLNGSRMLIGNGYMGYRGTTDEATKDEITSLIINGVYDKYKGGWREPVNFPNPLCMRLFYNDQILFLQTDNDLQYHDQSLNFRYGLYKRKSSWKKEAVIIHIASERFASMNNPHLLCQKYYISSDQQCQVTVLSGIDSSVHDIYGPHFTIINNKNYVDTNTGGRGMISVKNTIEGKTLENNEPWCISKLIECGTNTDITSTIEEVVQDGVYGAKITYALKPGQVAEFIVYAAVYTGLDFTVENDHKHNECVKAAEDELIKAVDEGYEKLYSLHKKKWDTLWDDGDVVIKGDAEAQKSLRFSLYHLHAIAPRTDRILSIPARGLSGQTYKGAVFWDTELFILPYFLFTEPETAKKLIQYRISTLDGARRKASLYGYKGAFYAWESQDTGDDVCSDYNVIDVFTRRPMRTYFKDKQIHISSAIVYAIQQYITISGNTQILYEGAFEVILECARFYASRCVYIPLRDRYEILDVLGRMSIMKELIIMLTLIVWLYLRLTQL